MTNTEFQNIFESLLDYLGKKAREHGKIQSVNDDYYEAFDKMGAVKFSEVCKVTKQHHQYKTLPSIKDMWGFYFKYVKADTKTEVIECAKCGGSGQIGIRARIINKGDYVTSHGGWRCTCKNGDRFRKGDNPWQNFFDRHGAIVSAHRLIIEDGSVYYPGAKRVMAVFDAEYMGDGQYIYHGLANTEELKQQRNEVIEKAERRKKPKDAAETAELTGVEAV